MKRSHTLLLALSGIMALGAGAGSQTPPETATVQELRNETWLFEVLHYVFDWYVDERDIPAVAKSGKVVFWVRELKPKLDEGDHSRFGEVVLPQFSLRVKVKNADYAVPELGVKIKTGEFKVVSVESFERGEHLRKGFTEVRADYARMRDRLFKTRNRTSFPDAALLERMRAALWEEIEKDYEDRHEKPPPGVQTAYLASFSPVANEAWVFWETGRMIIRFASDIDLDNPAVWEHEKLAVTDYHIDRHVVITLDEVGGSNEFMTRNEAGRALFNCLVLGKKVEVQFGAPGAAPK
jgi:hypothetical protein